MKAWRAASRARTSSTASNREMCSSPSRPVRHSTSSCHCSARSSPTPAACCRTPQSSPANTASRAWSERATRRSSSPTARQSASTGTPAKCTSTREGAPVKSVVPLLEAREESLYGSKAVGLGDATRAGLPIPPGIALSGEMVDAIVEGDTDALGEVMQLARDVPVPLAVRSSAVDEDGADASFAGQHLTLLNVRTADDVEAALRDIWWSANSDSAITYRKRVGLFTRPSIGVVIQSLLAPDSAGVMFTQNPINGADECVIEAGWGLGEVVVAGRVIPDHFRIDRAGVVVERVPGVKKVMLRTLPDGGTE